MDDGFTPQYRVVVIDDEPDLRILIEVMLDVDERFRLVGQAASGDEGVRVAETLQPDVIVLDLQLPGIDGMSALPELRRVSPRSRIVVFSAFPDPYTLLEVVRRGADAYLDKATAWSQLLNTLAAVCEAGEAEEPDGADAYS
jgi:DNA-binding NarL/FixJ family response regulator